jgi:hypothetical protein
LKRARRGLDLKTTFYDALGGIESKINGNCLTHDQAIEEITQMIATKAFVRSDSVEKFARSLRREVKAVETTIQRKEELYNELVSQLKSLTWD